jgi:hypothetical protein
MRRRRKCQFHIYDKYFNGFDDTPECLKEGVKRMIFLGDRRAAVFCEEHFSTVEWQTRKKL